VSPEYVGGEPQRQRTTRSRRDLTWTLLSFRGRIPRSVFWLMSLASIVGFYVCAFVIATLFSARSAFMAPAFMLLFIPMVWISLAIATKRWHDRDKSGWWQLVQLVPILGPIISFVETGCLRGKIGRNRFGEDPIQETRSGLTFAEMNAGILRDATVIELDESRVTDEHLSLLAGYTQVEELRLGGTSVTDAGLAYLRELTTLRQLDLSLTEITDDGLAALLGLTQLHTLWIGGTKVSSAGLKQLAALVGLREIHAANTSITADGVRDFENSRPDCVVYV